MLPQKQSSAIFKLILTCLIFLVVQGQFLTIQAQNTEEADRKFQDNSCPQDAENLTSLMLKDLPDYANRIIQRTQNLHRSEGFDTYVVFAGKSELEPLNLPQIQYNPVTSNNPKQIFFTTSERHYIDNTRQISTQNYHWLFLTNTSSGWRMVTMFSRFSSSATKNPPIPPIESSSGIVGQAISLWLRDCRANTIQRQG